MLGNCPSIFQGRWPPRVLTRWKRLRSNTPSSTTRFQVLKINLPHRRFLHIEIRRTHSVDTSKVGITSSTTWGENVIAGTFKFPKNIFSWVLPARVFGPRILFHFFTSDEFTCVWLYLSRNVNVKKVCSVVHTVYNFTNINVSCEWCIGCDCEYVQRREAIYPWTFMLGSTPFVCWCCVHVPLHPEVKVMDLSPTLSKLQAEF